MTDADDAAPLIPDPRRAAAEAAALALPEPLTLYVHPCFRIDWHGAADAAFVGLGLEDWRQRAMQAEAEVVILQGIVDSLAERVAAQSELLSRRAEGP